MKIPTIISSLAACLGTLHATPRTSPQYTINPESVAAGGYSGISSDYGNEGIVGGIAGLAQTPPTLVTAKTGYMAQLYEAAALTITSDSPSVNEMSTVQLGAYITLDDASVLALPPGMVDWNVPQEAFSGISPGGLATAPAVYSDTIATISGNFSGFTSSINLTIANTVTDNFGIYASDGISDDWQLYYFGLDNPQALPEEDADGDGFNNRFEYHAVLSPVDALSYFSVGIVLTPEGYGAVRFSPRSPGSTYEVFSSVDLSDWTPVTGLIIDEAAVRTVYDPSPPQSRRFYQIRVSRP